MLKRESYEYREKKNIKFFLNMLKNIDENNNFKECINKDLSKFLENIFFWSLRKDILEVDFLYEFIPKWFLLDGEQDKAVIENILNTVLDIPLDQAWKFYYPLNSKQKIKKLFLGYGKYFSGRVGYLLISQFDLIELVELFDELRKLGEASFFG